MKKKIATTIILFWLTGFSTLLAQTPQAINYQTVIRDNSGDEVINQLVDVRISILQGSATGTAIYVETHSDTTDMFGILNLQIGNGTVVSGDFSNVPWGDDTYFIQTEIDATGNNNYELAGTSQFLSVPYALYAEETRAVPPGGIIMWSGSIANIPDGWVLCDGNNGTPDLRDRFVIGAGAIFSVGEMGGDSLVDISHSHTVPGHKHDLPFYTGSHNSGDIQWTYDNLKYNSTPTSARKHNAPQYGGSCYWQYTTELSGNDTTNQSGNTALNILNPYFALAFIMKL